jgi:hypothetical protein
MMRVCHEGIPAGASELLLLLLLGLLLLLLLAWRFLDFTPSFGAFLRRAAKRASSWSSSTRTASETKRWVRGTTCVLVYWKG